ncbi:MAG: AMP-binding protein, partial [Planctomycetota bacterium]
VEAFHAFCRERAGRRLALEGPLVDSVLVPLEGERTGWYLNQHHLVTDAWSTQILFRQVGESYTALSEGRDAGEIQPTDYVRSAPASAPAEPRSKRASGARPIEFYGRRPQSLETRNVRVKRELDEKRSAALDRIRSERGFATLSPELSRFTVLSTLVTAWLHRISGQSEIALDAPVAGRSTPEAKRTPGMFIEMRPFEVEIDPGLSFRELGVRCLEESFALLERSAEASADTARNVVLNYVPGHFGAFADLETTVEWIHPGHADSIHALRLQVHDLGESGRLQLHFDFDEGAFSERLRERAIEHFFTVLDGFVDDVDASLDSIPLVSSEEERASIEAGTGPQPALPTQTVVDRFRETALREPNRVALRLGTHEESYRELSSKVVALAASLRARGVQRGDRVAILSRRSVEAVVAILAVLDVGAAYVPVDPSYPESRRQFLLDDSGAKLILADDVAPTGEVLRIAEAIAAGLDKGPDAPTDGPSLDDLAYVIYTSGSTGRPKGVSVEHLGLASYLEWAENTYVRGEALRFALFTSLSFDLTVTSLFLPLMTGGTAVIYPEPEGPVDTSVLEVGRDNAVDFVKLTPSHLSLLRSSGLRGSTIRCFVLGGEDFKRD